MRPSCGHLGGQALPVGGAQLLHLAVAEQGLDDRVLAAQLLEGAGVGGEPGLGLADRGEAQLLVEDGAQLGYRVDLERARRPGPGWWPRGSGTPRPVPRRWPGARPGRRGCRPPPCGPAPGPAAARCRRRGRPPPPAARASSSGGRSRASTGGQAHGLRGRPDRSRAGRHRRRPHRRASRTKAALPLGPRAVVDLDPEVPVGQVAEPVAVGGRVEQVGGHGGVDGQPGDVDAEREQRPHQLLGVVGHHPDPAGPEPGGQRGQRPPDPRAGRCRPRRRRSARWAAPAGERTVRPAARRPGPVTVRGDRPGSPDHRAWSGHVAGRLPGCGHQTGDLGHGGGGRRERWTASRWASQLGLAPSGSPPVRRAACG